MIEINQFKKSVGEIAKMLGTVAQSVAADKLGQTAALEEHVRLIVESFVARATGRCKLRFKRLDHFRGDLPAYQTAGASGLDVRACLDESITLAPGQRGLVPTGLALEIPIGFEVQVRPRSGLAIKKGLGLVNSPGTVDADYRGELKVIVINLGQETIEITDQERVAQLVVCPVVQAQIEEADELSDTARGAGGFGSTGA